MGFLFIPKAGAGFFLSAWITMILWGIISPEFGIKTVGYPPDFIGVNNYSYLVGSCPSVSSG